MTARRDGADHDLLDAMRRFPHARVYVFHDHTTLAEVALTLCPALPAGAWETLRGVRVADVVSNMPSDFTFVSLDRKPGTVADPPDHCTFVGLNAAVDATTCSRCVVIGDGAQLPSPDAVGFVNLAGRLCFDRDTGVVVACPHNQEHTP